MNDKPLIETPKQRPEALSLVDEAKAIVIACTDDLVRADRVSVALLEMDKLIVKDFEGPKAMAHDLHKAICAQEKGHRDPVLEARKVLVAKIKAENDRLEKLRQDEERRLQDLARKAAEDAKLDDAAAAEDSGDVEAAEEIIQAPTVVTRVSVPSYAPKLSTRVAKVKKWRLVNRAKIKPDYLVPNEAAIGALVRSSGKAAEAIVGGIEVYEV